MNKYYSQHGEDAILDMVFGDQKEGFFVEVGCIDGRCFSNTLAFEERGWKGMCVEAHSGYIDLLKKNRPNSIICHCAAGEADEDAIFYANARGSLSTLDKTSEARWQRDYAPYFSGFEEQQVKKVRLSTLLDAYQIGEIDILSLDIEGYEVEAMKGLDLSRHRPRVMVIESDDEQHEAQLDELILPYGYTKSIRLFANLFYVRDKALEKKLKGKKQSIQLTHTQHPLDSGGDHTQTLAIDTNLLTTSPSELARRRSKVIAIIKNMLRPLVRWVRANVGAPAVQESKSFGRMAVRDRYADIKARIATESPTIIDGGANDGSTTYLFLQQYRSPVIHAFEPIPELVGMLKQNFAGRMNVTIHGAAIGAEAKTVSFNVVNNLVSSSVLNPSALNKGIHGEKMDIRQVVEVPQVRLEDVMQDSSEIDLLKLDLQGYELEALKGCGSLLERIKIISTEIEFVALYDGQPLFGDIDVFLRAHGFSLLNLYELYTHPDGQLTAGDAVYLNSKYY